MASNEKERADELAISRSRLDPIYDLRDACYHEAGHKVAADFFGLNGQFAIGVSGACCNKQRAFNGTTTWDEAVDPFVNAVVAWAGPLAERQLNRCRYDPSDYLSDKDRCSVETCSPPARERALKRADEISCQLWEAIKALAEDEQRKLAQIFAEYIKALRARIDFANAFCITFTCRE